MFHLDSEVLFFIGHQFLAKQVTQALMEPLERATKNYDGVRCRVPVMPRSKGSSKLWRFWSNILRLSLIHI